jgi:hypothetical protein
MYSLDTASNPGEYEFAGKETDGNKYVNAGVRR